VVQQFNGNVRFVVENYGQSKLATRFGVKRYPAIFVDDILVATPNDFGFFGKGEGNSGRYAPLRSAASHDRFRADLTRMLQLVLAGKTDAARARAASATTNEIASMPQLHITDLDGKPLTREQLNGRIVVVEFWATWCPPCRGTLEWLGTLKKKYGARVAVVGIAVESPEADVRKLTRELALPVRWALATPELARSFGDISAVPTLFLFDKTGKTAGVFYGAPPTLHAAVETKVAAVIR
jgi:cytochrome c biogenesis protein CcmG, thiol:disulfide interchange protein DsbE